MQEQGFGKPTDAHSIIERSLEGGGAAPLDRLPTGVVQRYVELEMSRASAPIDHRDRLPARPAVRVHARMGWSRFLMMSTVGSGVGAAAVVDMAGRVLELTTLAAASAAWVVTPVSSKEGDAILRVLVAAQPLVITRTAEALAGVVPGASEVTLV